MTRARPATAALAGACLATALLAVAAAAQPPGPESFYGHESLAFADGAHGFLVNPANGGLRYPNEFAFSFADLEPGRNLYGGAWSSGGFGLAASRFEDLEQRYVVALRGGEDRLRAGLAGTYRVSEIDGDRVIDWKLGLSSRPRPWLSIGATLDHLGQPRIEGERARRLWGAGLGLRPFALSRPHAHTLGTRFTLTADAIVREGDDLARADLVFGAEIEPLPGIAIVGSVEEHLAYRVGISLRGARASSHVHYDVDRDGDHAATVYTTSLHDAEDRTVFAGPRERRIVTVGIGGALVDDDLSGVSLFGRTGGSVVGPIHRALERALDDPLTRGVLIDVRHPSGMAQLEELRARILRLRAAGKPVVAYLETGGNRGALYLASACDRVVTTDEALFYGLGLRAERRYYKSLLERWGLHVDRASIGPYKSAYRSWSVDSIPPADREVIEHNLDLAQEEFVGAIADGRKIPRDRFLHVLDGRDWDPADLLAAGLIDNIGSRQDARELAGKLADLGVKPRMSKARDLARARTEWTIPRRLAIVYASGGIETGSSASNPWDGPYMGSETVIRQLERAFQSDDVEAVVLRVDSPGGSATASNLIHAATVRLKRETEKPLVVSMGGAAASGGYYIACAADRIYADRLTATGSIGVVYIKPSLERWYEQRDVPQVVFERGAYMGGTSFHHDWDPSMQASADSAVGRSYASFVSRVAAGRGRTPEQIREVAQGRVWYGVDAIERGLVDELGGLEAAIAEARRRAGVPEGEKIEPWELRRERPHWLERAVGSLVEAAWERNMSLRDPRGVRYEADGLFDE